MSPFNGKTSVGVLLGLIMAGLPVISFAMARRPPEDKDQPKEKVVAPKEVKESLAVIEGYPGISRAVLHKAMMILHKNPRVSTPLLADCFTDRAKEMDLRMICSGVLEKNTSHITREQQVAFEAVLQDEGEQLLPRMQAAILLLNSRPLPSSSTRKKIKQVSFRCYKEGKHKSHILMAIFSHFRDDSDIEKFLVEQLYEEADYSRRNGLLYALGKRKNKAALSIIEKELRSENPQKFLRKTRMYLALGDIGGKHAFNILLEQLHKEKNSTEQAMILYALGASKDPRAKDVLLDFVLTEPRTQNIAAMDGLKYLGDPAAIPALEKELRRTGLSAYEKRRLRKTIDAIRNGDDATGW